MKNPLVKKYNKLTGRYNSAISMIVDAYQNEIKGKSLSTSEKRELRKSYSTKYLELYQEYEEKRKQVLPDFMKDNPRWKFSRNALKWLFIFGLIVAFGVMGYALPDSEEAESEQTASAAMGQQETVYWNAENIEIPYLKDSTQYVANPDYVLSQEAVDRMNVTLQKLEKQLGIQSVFIVVNHIENDDPFRFAQDVGNKYGVGYNDLGLVVVVGYEDHSINMSPGRKLEAELTDAECHRLEQEYVVPAMRAELPDSGMIYLAEAVYAKLEKKELPQMSALADMDDEEGEREAIIIVIFFLFVSGWLAVFLVLNNKYLWLGTSDLQHLRDNPFDGTTSRRSRGYSSYGGYWGGGHGSGGGSWGGGGFSGGSFGGGSFGGGGATSRW